VPVVGRCRRVRGITAVSGRRIDADPIPSWVFGVAASEVRNFRIVPYSTDGNPLKVHVHPWTSRETQ
jgi:hypothetical protein